MGEQIKWFRKTGQVLTPLGGAPESRLSDQPRFTARELIDAIYAALLSRPASEREIDHALFLLDAGQPSSAIAQLVVDRAAFTKRVADVRERFGLKEDRLIHDSSQCGEVELLLKTIVNDSCPHRIVVDVGARGREISNAYDLLRYLGWRGVLIEANPDLIDQILEEFSGLDCVVESCAISDHEGEAPFSVGLNDDISSLDEARAAKWGPVHRRPMVPVRRLGPVLERHDVPRDFDVLSLDIEGHDVRVLNDLVGTTAYRPKWILIEGPSGGWETDLEKIGCSLEVRGAYGFVANTPANLLLKLK